MRLHERCSGPTIRAFESGTRWIRYVIKEIGIQGAIGSTAVRNTPIKFLAYFLPLK
jgi:hypothetical protein